MAKSKSSGPKKATKKQKRSQARTKIQAATPAKRKSSAKKKKKEDLMCFLTTACIRVKGLNDDCYELNTLRKFRDEYLLKTETGKVLVEEYYGVAPQIVQSINNGHSSKRDYAFIYKCIKQSCFEIESGLPEHAQRTYSEMVFRLKKKYAL